MLLCFLCYQLSLFARKRISCGVHGEVACAISVHRYVVVGSAVLGEVDEPAERLVLSQHLGVAHHQHVQTGARHGYIQLAVDAHGVLLERVVREEVELVALSHGEAVDDIVALRTLVAFYGVDGDVVELVALRFSLLSVGVAVHRAVCSVDGAAYRGNLVAVGHDDPHGFVSVEGIAVVSSNSTDDVCHDVRFGRVHLFRKVGTLAEGTFYEIPIK